MIPYLFNLIYLDTLCGTPASGIKIGDTPKAVGTYTNYDHIIIPGGKRPPSSYQLEFHFMCPKLTT